MSEHYLNSYQRVKAALEGEKPDRVPLFEVWIDALHQELGVSNPALAHPELGQDVILLPSAAPLGSKSWKDGVDEFGRVWHKGLYRAGVLKTLADLRRFSPPSAYAEQFFSEIAVEQALITFPDHFPFFGTHVGPFMSTYMAMGMENMFCSLYSDRAFVEKVMDTRTDWCLALFRQAIRLGAELIVMGDDAAHRGGAMISPAVWQQLVLPHHRRIVEELSVPVIWHSDGRMDELLPFAVQAGFAGVHGLEPPAGNNLAAIKQQYGRQLMLIGNIDVNLLCGSDHDALCREVDRCLRDGGDKMFMLSTSNSIFKGMNPSTVKTYFNLISANS